MAELNRSDWFLNNTNPTWYFSFSSGSFPSKTALIVTYSVIMFLSLIGNSLVLAIFYRSKQLKTTVNYFIVNMAISDLIIPVIYLPWQISNTYHDGLWLVDGVPGTILCKFVKNVWITSMFVSILSMVAIAVDRFHAIVFAMKPPLISRKTCRVIIILTWVGSVAFRGHSLYASRLIQKDTGLRCVFQWEPASATKKAQKATWISFLFLFAVSAIVLTVLYSCIILLLQRQKNKLLLASEVIKLRAKENRRITCMLVTIVVLFYVVWIPYHVESFIYHFISTIRVPRLVFWFVSVLPMLYPVVNPVVYYLFSENYRQGFRELLCCPCPACKCSGCFQTSRKPQCESNDPNSWHVNNVIENNELQEQC